MPRARSTDLISATLRLPRWNTLAASAPDTSARSNIRWHGTLQWRPEAPCEDVIRIAKGHIDAVQIRIVRLQVLKSELDRILRRCTGAKMADCRIIEALSTHECFQATPSRRVANSRKVI